MIPLASIEGNLIFLIVAAVVGVINWLIEKKKKESEGAPPRPPAPRRESQSRSAGSDSEEERLRRFMEALGVPSQKGQSPPQPQRPAPAKPKQRPPAQVTARQRERRQQAGKPDQKTVLRPPQPVFTEPEEFQTAGRLEEAASSIERIAGEFSAINVRVAMTPMQTFENPPHVAMANAGTTSVLEREGNPLVASLRRTLTDPTEIRAAFLAAELLGPPKGLQ